MARALQSIALYRSLYESLKVKCNVYVNLILSGLHSVM